MRSIPLLLLLASCGSKAPAAQPPPPPPAAKTCDDAAARAAELLEITDVAAIAGKCVEEQWTQDVIDCVAAAQTAGDGEACFAAMVAASPTCQTLAALIEAGRDRAFTSIQGEQGQFSQPFDFKSTVTLTGASICGIYVESGTLSCDILRTADQEEWDGTYQAAVGAIDACLAPGGWTAAEKHGGVIDWTSTDAGLPYVHLDVFQMDGEGYVRVEVKHQ